MLRSAIDPASLINTSHYPLNCPDKALYQKTLTSTRNQLNRDSCAVVSIFLSPLGLSPLLAEAEERGKFGYFSAKTNTNVYFSADDTSFSPDHSGRIFLKRTNGFITSDYFDDSTASRTLHNWPALMLFIQGCLGKNQRYIYYNPVSNMIVNVLTPRSQFSWHFDTNEFTITMLLKSATGGGHFEYSPNLKNANDECDEDVRGVIQADTQKITRLNLTPGELQLFLSRFSLHRVTQNTGRSDRMLLIISFTEKSGMIGSVARTQKLYGKVTEQHLMGRERRVRADKLID